MATDNSIVNATNNNSDQLHQTRAKMIKNGEKLSDEVEQMIIKASGDDILLDSDAFRVLHAKMVTNNTAGGCWDQYLALIAEAEHLDAICSAELNAKRVLDIVGRYATPESPGSLLQALPAFPPSFNGTKIWEGYRKSMAACASKESVATMYGQFSACLFGTMRINDIRDFAALKRLFDTKFLALFRNMSTILSERHFCCLRGYNSGAM